MKKVIIGLLIISLVLIAGCNRNIDGVGIHPVGEKGNQLYCEKDSDCKPYNCGCYNIDYQGKEYVCGLNPEECICKEHICSEKHYGNCSDNIKNQDEMGIDCGGYTCKDCIGNTCKTHSDCDYNSTFCNIGECQCDEGECQLLKY